MRDGNSGKIRAEMSLPRCEVSDRTAGLALFEQLFRRDREAVGNVRRAVGDFEQVAA